MIHFEDSMEARFCLEFFVRRPGRQFEGRRVCMLVAACGLNTLTSKKVLSKEPPHTRDV